ncbi:MULTISPECIES: DUF488 domain-containing protein [unclassified Bradyrhizobium]|uniref:DUF488 domain-containing protein n=1 Tax=unclassified Bradyrhizobium TaxID=2631580 RepID=UPI00291606A5|nr:MULTISPECIES: DUF488 domain-containing protein [unclassified Bradyrhizobium]
MVDAVYTIGHSTHAIEKLIELLKGQNITAVCDVRSRPYSRMNPQFNREPLKKALRESGIKYVFLGAELGARSDDKNCYRNGQVQYDLLARTDLFKKGIERVKEGARTYRLALMCAEKEPLECHRTILVSRTLFEEGIPIKHILSDGAVEDHAHAINRLIALLRIPGSDMFRSDDAVVREAYTRQGNEIAYREQSPEASVPAGANQKYAGGT